MRIRTDTGKLSRLGEELLNASRSVKRLRDETEDVRRELRQLSQMDECRAALARQEEALYRLAAGLVGLSAALEQISGTYAASEERNVGSLEEAELPSRTGNGLGLYGGLDSGFKAQIDQILYQ